MAQIFGSLDLRAPLTQHSLAIASLRTIERIIVFSKCGALGFKSLVNIANEIYMINSYDTFKLSIESKASEI